MGRDGLEPSCAHIDLYDPTDPDFKCQWFPYPDIKPAPNGWILDYDLENWILPSYQEESDKYDFGCVYYPINIFWNEELETCVSDCAAAGTHHVNPQPYNPIDVFIWASLYTTNSNGDWWFAPDNQLRRWLFYPEYNTNDPDCCPQENPDEPYWIPYNSSWGDFTCLCDVDHGFVLDEEKDDGSCFNCASLGDSCTWCSYDGSDWYCDECSSDAMLSPNETSCVPKIYGCSVDVANQPDLLDTMTIGTGPASYGVYVCPWCNDGYYKDSNG